jgi:hypothetical protein
VLLQINLITPLQPTRSTPLPTSLKLNSHLHPCIWYLTVTCCRPRVGLHFYCHI